MVTDYKNNSDDTITEVLTEAKEKFEYWRKSIGLFLGPLIGIIFYFVQ